MTKMELRDGIQGWNGLRKPQMREKESSAQITILIILLDIGTYEL